MGGSQGKSITVVNDEQQMKANTFSSQVIDEMMTGMDDSDDDNQMN